MEPMIQVENLCKSFSTKSGTVEAARNISFSIEKGEIFGIIGLSGAGKSTLVRCLNLLERPTSGSVWVNGKNLTELSERKLRKERQNIGMIFQHFNLLMQRTALDNVCFPMEIVGISKKEARKKALEYLKIVGLEEKALSYPSQLSGGQQQRLCIARTLAVEPEVKIETTDRLGTWYIYEPGCEQILTMLYPLMMHALMYDLLMENKTSEQAARILAMQMANDNAVKLLGKLQLEYNKLRQQGITSELLDIAGGSNRES